MHSHNIARTLHILNLNLFFNFLGLEKNFFEMKQETIFRHTFLSFWCCTDENIPIFETVRKFCVFIFGFIKTENEVKFPNCFETIYVTYTFALFIYYLYDLNSFIRNSYNEFQILFHLSISFKINWLVKINLTNLNLIKLF